MYRMVIVDDEAPVRDMLANYVRERMAEYEVERCFSSGTQAWRYLEAREVDLVVSDVRMPGMSGIELARLVLARWPDTVVGIVTGYSEFEYARQAIACGVSSFLLKPLKMSDFADALAHMARRLDGNRRRRALETAQEDDALDAFFSEMQTGELCDEEELKRRYRRLKLSIPEEEARGQLFQLNVVSPDGRRGDHDKQMNAIVNVLRMSFPRCMLHLMDWNERQARFLTLHADIQAALDSALAEQKIADALNMRVAIAREADFSGLTQLCALLSPRDRLVGKSKAAGENRAIDLAREYIEEHYDRELSRYIVASQVGLNPVYFGRRFKEVTGEQFGDYLIRVRMRKAIQLLFEPLRVAQISEMVGYANYRYFVRVFREYTTYTPTEYRRCVIRREESDDDDAK